MFQLMFAIITPALISGAIADRAKFGRWVALRRRLGHHRLLPGRALGVRLRRPDVRTATAGWLANARRRGLRRWNGGPHQRRCRGPRPGARARQARGLAEGADAAAQPAVRHARRRPAVVRLVRLQRRLRRSPPSDLAGIAFINTIVATCAALLGWLIVEKIRDGKPTTLGAASGAVAGLVAITPACGVRRPRRRDRPRPHRRCRLRPRGRPEVQVRLRRLARRRRRPPGRRHHRHAAHRLLRHQARSTSGRRDGLFYGGGFDPARQAGDRGGFAVLSTRSSSTLDPRLHHQVDHRLPRSARRTRSTASTSPSTLRPPTTSRASSVADSPRSLHLGDVDAGKEADA